MASKQHERKLAGWHLAKTGRQLIPLTYEQSADWRVMMITGNGRPSLLVMRRAKPGDISVIG
jgi:hypothetical protein